MRLVIFFQTLFSLIFCVGNGQTVLIDPYGAGNFSLGNTLESNGWTVLNFDNKNGWALGTPHDGSKAAFSSANWASSNPVPGIDGTDLGKASHMYRDITVPPGEEVLELNFDLRMRRGFFVIWITTPDVVPGPGTINIFPPTGSVLFEDRIPHSQEMDSWVDVSTHTVTAQAGSTIRLVFTFSYSASMTFPAGISGPAVKDIYLTSRQPITFMSEPGSFDWENAAAWIPAGRPLPGDNIHISQGSTISSSAPYGFSAKNITVAGNLNARIATVSGDLIVTATGRLVLQKLWNGIIFKRNFKVEPGGYVDGRLTNFQFTRWSFEPQIEQVFSFHSPQQFEAGAVLGLSMQNPEGLKVHSDSGRLGVCSLLNIGSSGVLMANNALELNHRLIANTPYTLLGISNPAGLSGVVPKAAGARVGIRYSGNLGFVDSPYVMGTFGEWNPGDTLFEFSIGRSQLSVKCPDDLYLAAALANQFQLYGALVLAEGKSAIFTQSSFPGTTRAGFPGPNTRNIFNNAHVSGGNGVLYRLNGTNLSRVWPTGIDGQQFVFGMYGIDANNALVRVSMIKSEEGVPGNGINQINPQYRHRVEVLEGTLSKVDSVNLGYNIGISGFMEGDIENRRATRATSLNGTFENIGGPKGGIASPTAFMPEWNVGWIRSDLGNYNTSSFYSLALSSGNFPIMWRNREMGNFLWDDPANWTGNAVPTRAIPVLLNAPGSTITVSENSACKQLTIINGTKFIVPPGVNFKIGE